MESRGRTLKTLVLMRTVGRGTPRIGEFLDLWHQVGCRKWKRGKFKGSFDFLASNAGQIPGITERCISSPADGPHGCLE